MVYFHVRGTVLYYNGLDTVDFQMHLYTNVPTFRPNSLVGHNYSSTTLVCTVETQDSGGVIEVSRTTRGYSTVNPQQKKKQRKKPIWSFFSLRTRDLSYLLLVPGPGFPPLISHNGQTCVWVRGVKVMTQTLLGWARTKILGRPYQSRRTFGLNYRENVNFTVTLHQVHLHSLNVFFLFFFKKKGFLPIRIWTDMIMKYTNKNSVPSPPHHPHPPSALSHALSKSHPL